MKNTLFAMIVLIVFLNCTAQNQKEMIVGTWRFEKECDLRTEEEKSKYVEVVIKSIEIETENGTEYPYRIFKVNNEFEFYYNKNQSTIGIFEINNQTLFYWRLIPLNKIEAKPKVTESLLNRKLIEKKYDGNFYFSYPLKLEIKSITKNRIEFGTENNYTVWKRI